MIGSIPSAEGGSTEHARGGERGRARDVLVIALAAALVAALVFVARWGYVWYGRREVVGVSRDLGWSAPLATLLIWLPPALCGASLARWLPRPWVARLSGFVFFTLTALSVFIPIGGLARPAVGVLSLGIGVAVGRWLASSPGAVVTLRTVALACGILLSAAAFAFPRFEHSRRLARVPSRPPVAAGARNVLVIVLDAVRADAMGMYGARRATSPHLDALAGSGVRFAQAIATAPWTRPTHRSIFTGEYPQLWPGGGSTFLARMDADPAPRLAEWFAARGYATGAFVANFFYTGWDAGFAAGFARYQDFPRSAEQVLRTSTLGQTVMARSLYAAQSPRDVWGALLANDFSVPPRPLNAEKEARAVTDEFLAWHGARGGRPFFAFLNYFDAHLPYDPPPPYRTRFSVAPTARDSYDGAVAYMDAEVGRLLGELRARGALDQTLVVLTSDHGELFGEHGLYEHTSNLYHKLLHVPLVLRLPERVPAGLVTDRVVSLRDLPATITDLALPGNAHPFPGTSLASLWREVGTAPPSAALALVERGVRSDSSLPFTRGDMVSLHDDRWHFVRNYGTGREELYCYREDPFEATDHAPLAAADSVRTRLRRQVDSLLQLHKLGTPGTGRSGGGTSRANGAASRPDRPAGEPSIKVAPPS